MHYLSRHGWLIGLALLYTLLNTPKPLTVDDGAYYYFARQITQDPLRPYNFEMFWYQHPHPAISILAPPVLPYWWALGMTLLGDEPWLWKLWLFPFALGFVLALYSLSRRFARGIETHLVCLTVLSPLFLPSLNLMLDVPALALGLGALAVLDRACGRRSILLAALAGLLAGLAMQTKYTMFVIPLAMLLYGVLVFRPWLGLLAAVLAGSVFIGWEYFIVAQHGKSHFMANLPQLDRETWIIYKLFVAKALLPMIGGTMPALPLLGLAALGCPAGFVAVIGALIAMGYVAIACFEVPAILLGNSFWLEHPLEQVIFGTSGLLLCGVALAAGCVLLFGSRGDDFASLEEDASPTEIQEPPHSSAPATRRSPIALVQRNLDWFLLLWLLMELGAYFAGALAVPGRSASDEPGRRRHVRAGQACGADLHSPGAADVVDLHRRRRRGCRDAVLRSGPDRCVCAAESSGSGGPVLPGAPPDADNPSPTIWYVGHWGFQFYAERAGMKPVVPDEFKAEYVLRRGDWLVVPDARWEQQNIIIDPEFAQAERAVIVPEVVPLRTVRCFYGGYVPMEHHSEKRMEVTIYRVIADRQPRTPLRRD